LVLALHAAPYVLTGAPLVVLCHGCQWLSGHVMAFVRCVPGSIVLL
jgi:hypothetical protein